MTKGNQKGSAFERDMCRAFSLWYTSNQVDDLFWRTSGSGSRATNRAAAGNDLTKYQHGDMTFIRPEGQALLDYFSFEFKSYSGIDFHGIFHTISPDKSLLSFWAKGVRDAEVSGRVPILVTKVIRGKPVIWFPSAMLSVFTSAGYGVIADRGFQFWVPISQVVTKRTYPRRKKGAKKAKKGKGKPKIETYDLPEPQHVVGISLESFFSCLQDPQRLMLGLQVVGLERMPVPRRKDPAHEAA